MANDQTPADSNARHEGAPLSQPTSLPTRMSSTRGAVELPGDTPESLTPAPPVEQTQQQNEGVERPELKSEGSAYASSYRPSDPPESLPPVYANCRIKPLNMLIEYIVEAQTSTMATIPAKSTRLPRKSIMSMAPITRHPHIAKPLDRYRMIAPNWAPKLS